MECSKCGMASLKIPSQTITIFYNHNVISWCSRIYSCNNIGISAGMLWNVKFRVWLYRVRVFCTKATKFKKRIGFKMHICIFLCTIDKSLEHDNVEFNFMAVFFNEISLDSDHYEFGLSSNMIESSDQECCWIGDVRKTLLSHILRDHKNQIIT